VGRRNNWLGLKLAGVDCHADATGARITWSFGGNTRSLLKSAGGSYLSSHDPRVVLGIGPIEKIDSVEIHWPAPGTHVDRLVNPPMDRYLRVVEGKGITG